MRKRYRLNIQTGDLKECEISDIRVNDIFIIADVEDNDIKRIFIKHACGEPFYLEENKEWMIDCKPLFLL